MKMVVAYVRHEAFEAIRADLLEAGFPSITITEVKARAGRRRSQSTIAARRSPSTCVRS